MRSRSASWALALACAAAAPASVAAQAGWEVQLQGLGTFAEQRFLGGGAGIAVRSAGRARLALAVNAGDRDGAFAGRGELVATYHLSPYRRRGVSLYGGGGVTVGATADDTFEYLVLLVGIETTPGSRTGWFVEVGVAGGVRLSAGFRIKGGARTS
jgi:hypothetical protein